MGGGASTLTLKTISGEKLTFSPVPYKAHKPKHTVPFFCYLDVKILDAKFAKQVKKEPGGAVKQRIVIQLHADRAPKTCENFRGLCTGTQALRSLFLSLSAISLSLLHVCGRNHHYGRTHIPYMPLPTAAVSLW